MIKKLLTISLMFVCPFASAKPINLNCSTAYSQGYDKTYFSVKLDEWNQSVTHANSYGQIEFETTAFFQPNRISYQNSKTSNGATFSSLYEINRTTLSVTKTVNTELSGSVGINSFSLTEGSHTEFGSCSIAQASNTRI